MQKIAIYTLALTAAGAASLYAQESAPGACSTPEAIVVTGNSRVDSAAVRSTAGLSTGGQLNVHDIQAAINALYATAQFDDALKAQLRARREVTEYSLHAEYAAEMVRQALAEHYPEDVYTRGFRVYTTLRQVDQA